MSNGVKNIDSIINMFGNGKIYNDRKSVVVSSFENNYNILYSPSIIRSINN
jgi:hypothetical protein